MIMRARFRLDYCCNLTMRGIEAGSPWVAPAQTKPRRRVLPAAGAFGVSWNRRRHLDALLVGRRAGLLSPPDDGPQGGARPHCPEKGLTSPGLRAVEPPVGIDTCTGLLPVTSPLISRGPNWLTGSVSPQLATRLFWPRICRNSRSAPAPHGGTTSRLRASGASRKKCVTTSPCVTTEATAGSPCEWWDAPVRIGNTGNTEAERQDGQPCE